MQNIIVNSLHSLLGSARRGSKLTTLTTRAPCLASGMPAAHKAFRLARPWNVPSICQSEIKVPFPSMSLRYVHAFACKAARNKASHSLAFCPAASAIFNIQKLHNFCSQPCMHAMEEFNQCVSSVLCLDCVPGHSLPIPAVNTASSFLS